MLLIDSSPFKPAEMKKPHGWRERQLPRGSTHGRELLDADDRNVVWLPISAPDPERELDRAICKMFVAIAQFVSVPDELLALGFRNRPLSDDSRKRMAFALRLALSSLEDLRRG